MSQIKIIKKKATPLNSKPVRKGRESSAIDFELNHTIKGWISDWRNRKEAERQRALKELTRFKQALN